MKKDKKRKVLGIIGGMGPLATADFFKELVKRTDARKDWEHLHVIIDNDVSIPSRTRAALYNETSPVSAMRKSAKKLQAMGCDYLAVPCNSAHYFYEEVVQGLDIPWVNMIEIVTRELKHFQKILILGAYVTVTKKIYDRFINNTLYMKAEGNKLVSELVEKLKINSNYQ